MRVWRSLKWPVTSVGDLFYLRGCVAVWSLCWISSHSKERENTESGRGWITVWKKSEKVNHNNKLPLAILKCPKISRLIVQVLIKTKSTKSNITFFCSVIVNIKLKLIRLRFSIVVRENYSQSFQLVFVSQWGQLWQTVDPNISSAYW